MANHRTLIKRIVAISIALLCALLLAGYAYFNHVLYQPLNVEKSHVVEVSKGESLNAVLNRLIGANILPADSLWVTKLYLRIEAYQGRLIANQVKVGEFELAKGITIPELFVLLTSNKQIQYTVTLVEGTTFKDVQAQLATLPKLTRVLGEKSTLEIMAAVPINPIFKTFYPEGLFYPDTYRYQKGDTDLSILQRAHKRLVKVTKEEWAKRDDKLPLKTPYEALILASIVEKETGKPSEREEIAGVFIRRLEKKMRLQTDPTVIYGLGERYKGNITRKHLRELTPYNTYRINGLPPTPIALAGREAIHAVLHPADGKTLYFVAKGDGSHQFSETISQHNKAVREYQLKRRADYRSTHQATN